MNADRLRKQKADYQRRYRKTRTQISVAYEPNDFQRILKTVEKTGQSPTEFIRDCSLKKHVKAIDPNEKYKQEFKAEIRRIGHNINQMAHALNNYYQPADLTQITLGLNKNVAILKQLLEALK